MAGSWLGMLVLAPLASSGGQGALDQEPILYGSPASQGPVERLRAELEAGKLEFGARPGTGILEDLLSALAIPVSSQVLVFSKTSFQNDQITPARPRAVFFGDDVYVGAVPGAPLIEITSMDPEKGAVFYTLENRVGKTPELVRRGEECLQCHASFYTDGWPGNLVRSVHPDPEGHPIQSARSVLVDSTTPLAERWGGWYVTGDLGRIEHRGNARVSSSRGELQPKVSNVTDVSAWVEEGLHLTSHSDVVALLVLEHQAQVHNRIAHAAYQVRIALHRQAELNVLLGSAPTTPTASATRVLDAQARVLLDALLFYGEAPLENPVQGSSSFAQDFAVRGLRDGEGRSLRDLDLNTRLFRHRCSYVIQSPSFDALPKELLALVYRQLAEVLSGGPLSTRYPDLGPEERDSIRSILLAAKTGLPDGWGVAAGER